MRLTAAQRKGGSMALCDGQDINDDVGCPSPM